MTRGSKRLFTTSPSTDREQCVEMLCLRFSEIEIETLFALIFQCHPPGVLIIKNIITGGFEFIATFKQNKSCTCSAIITSRPSQFSNEHINAAVICTTISCSPCGWGFYTDSPAIYATTDTCRQFELESICCRSSNGSARGSLDADVPVSLVATAIG